MCMSGVGTGPGIILAMHRLILQGQSPVLTVYYVAGHGVAAP